MSVTRQAKESGADQLPRTLGDLLYSDPTHGRVLEDAWVALVQEMAAGDQRALRVLYERTHRLVFSFLARLLHDRRSAEELTLDTFHAVWRQAAQYDPAGGSVVGWIMNQARSRAIDRVRYEQRKKRTAPAPSEDACAVGAADGACAAVEALEQSQQLRECLSALTAGEREAIEAAFFLELSYPEVAVRLSQPLGTIKTRIRSGLEKLRQAWAVQEKRRS